MAFKIYNDSTIFDDLCTHILGNQFAEILHYQIGRGRGGPPSGLSLCNCRCEALGRGKPQPKEAVVGAPRLTLISNLSLAKRDIHTYIRASPTGS